MVPMLHDDPLNKNCASDEAYAAYAAAVYAAAVERRERDAATVAAPSA